MLGAAIFVNVCDIVWMRGAKPCVIHILAHPEENAGKFEFSACFLLEQVEGTIKVF